MDVDARICVLYVHTAREWIMDPFFSSPCPLFAVLPPQCWRRLRETSADRTNVHWRWWAYNIIYVVYLPGRFLSSKIRGFRACTSLGCCTYRYRGCRDIISDKGKFRFSRRVIVYCDCLTTYLSIKFHVNRKHHLSSILCHPNDGYYILLYV